MSEIKGQLLGIILVRAIFGVVLGAMTAAFTHASETIEDRVEDAAYTNTVKPDPNGLAPRNYTLLYK